MKATYDVQADVAYISLTDGRVAVSEEIASGIVLDCDDQTRILGIKLNPARKILAPGALASLPAREADLRAHFYGLFTELDGSTQQPQLSVTKACVEALFDRMISPPTLDTEQPEMEDVDTTERVLIDMIKDEATKVRELIGRPRPQMPPPA